MDWAFDIAGGVAAVALLLALTRPGRATGHVAVLAVALATMLGLMGTVPGAVGLVLLLAGALRLLPAPDATASRPAMAAGAVLGALTLAALAWRVDPAGGLRLGELADPAALLAKIAELYLFQLGALAALAVALYVARGQLGSRP
jgi:hypothetical protein